VPVEAETPLGDDGLVNTILLFAHDGRLSYLECVSGTATSRHLSGRIPTT
jgi:hypothetical protein